MPKKPQPSTTRRKPERSQKSSITPGRQAHEQRTSTTRPKQPSIKQPSLLGTLQNTTPRPSMALRKQQSTQLKATFAKDTKLAALFSSDVPLSRQMPKEDYENLISGKVCLQWVKLPSGKKKCVKWKVGSGRGKERKSMTVAPSDEE